MACPGPLARVLIQNNLFWAQGTTPFIAGGTTFELAGYAFCSVTGGNVNSTQILHNTMLGAGNNMVLSGGTPYNYTNLVIRDNLTEFDQYRWANVAGGCIDPCFNSQISTGGLFTVSNNAIVNSGAINGGQGISDSLMRMRYGSLITASIVDTNGAMNYSGAGFVNYPLINTDYHNFALLNSSPFAGQASDGTNPGVNFTLLDIALGTTPPTPNPPVIITTSPLPGGTNGVPYSFQFSATSTIPVTWSGSGLPGWASLSASGLLTGTPNAIATTTMSITATNTSGSDGPHSFAITIVGAGVAPTITSTSPIPNGTVGVNYSYQFQANGTAPIIWTGTNLPSWALLSTTGRLTGNPTLAATTTMHITATNFISSNGPTDFVLTIVQPAPPKRHNHVKGKASIP